MPLRSDAYADLPQELATGVGNRLIELAAQAEEGQVVRIHIAVRGVVGQSQPTLWPSYGTRSKSSRAALWAGPVFRNDP
jgi:hypothetical protein